MSSHQNARLCSLCQNINISRKLFPEQQSQLSDEELLRENFIELGTAESISARTDSCDLCTFVAGKIEEYERKFSDLWRKLEFSGYALEWQSYGSGSDKADLPNVTRHRLDIILQVDSEEDLRVMRIPSVLQPAMWPVPSLKSHVEDPTWPDYGSRGGRYRSLTCEPNTFGSWLRTCENRHKNCTLDSPAVPPVLRFIDTKLRCVNHAHLAANEGVRYVALSYMWGKNAQPLTLTRANFARLGEVGAIRHDDLPQTISDAIAVVEMLGERYLWVDALCIIQDNEDDLAAHLPLMGYIYEGALVTIIAASSTDANSGLPGVRQSRSPQHVIGPLDEGALISCPSPMLEEIFQFSFGHHYLQNSSWNTRGWTLQEKLFSRRCLYFTEEQVYWECKMDSWCEDSCFESHPLDPVAEKRCSWKEAGSGSGSTPFLEGIELGTRMTTPEEHDYFSDLLWSYSHRSFSFAEDIERAFAGLLKVLSERTGAQFWYGLPIPIFDACIWLDVSKGTVQRSTTAWPSWSWLALKGGLRLGNRYGPSYNDIPEIQCYRLCPCEGGQLSLERVSDRIVSLEESRPVLKWDIPTAVWRVLQPNFHILFWAQTCTFDVEDGEGPSSPVYHVLTEATEGDASERLIGFVARNGHGNFPSAGHHEFTRLQTEPAHREGVDRDECPQRHYAYLLSWHDGIAKREWSAKVFVDEWGKYAAPQWKLIIMG